MPHHTLRFVCASDHAANGPDTVTIDYDQTRQLFVSQQEKYPFSTERVLRMLNHWAKEERVQATGTRFHILIEEAHCILTPRAVQKLSTGYQHRHDWQAEYPFVSRLFFNTPHHPLPSS